MKRGWRGELHSKWEVLRLRSGNRAEILSLNEATRKRLETGLNGWAMHEGYNVTDDLSLVKADAIDFSAFPARFAPYETGRSDNGRR